jgi:pimeloyl-ACP methyl ester carboxylesterase
MMDTLLTALFGSIALVALFVINGYFWIWYYRAATEQDETVYFRTADGWGLAAHRYCADEDPRGLPVILCHGLGGNRYSFDLGEAPSLARFLKQRGRDVWVVELRGSGMSGRPGILRSDVPYSWGLDDHLHKDVPAVMKKVLERTGAPAVHWIGHSMGGLLALAYLAQNPHGPVASVVTIGSPTDFSKIPRRMFEVLLKFRWGLRICPFAPFPLVTRAFIPVLHWLPSYVQGLFHRPNIKPRVMRSIAALGSPQIMSARLWLEFGRFLESAALTAENGVPYLERLSQSQVPILALSGSKDLMAPPEAVCAFSRHVREGCEIRCVPMGKAFGCLEDYGHMDLLLGVGAEREVFPIIDEWLKEHDPSSGTQANSDSSAQE